MVYPPVRSERYPYVNTSFRLEGARITLLQFCAGLQSACTIAENSESVWKSNLTAKSSFVLAYRALVPLYKTQNQIHPAPQAKILRICTSTCKILPAPQANFFADLHFSNAKFYKRSPVNKRYLLDILRQKPGRKSPGKLWAQTVIFPWKYILILEYKK